MSFRVHAALLCVACGIASRAGAERYSLDEALKRAEEASPIVRRARAERQVVAAKMAGAKTLLPYNPVVSTYLDARRDVSGSVPLANGFEWLVRLDQTLEIAGQRGTRINEVQKAIEVASLREGFARVEMRARVRTAYLTVRINEAHAEWARKREELGKRLYESARARGQAGASSDVELHLAEVESGRITHERIEAELDVQTSLNALRQLLDVPVGTPLELTTELATPPAPEKPIEALLDEARQRRADLKALAKYGTQLDATIVRLRREVVPSPSIYVEAGQQQPGQTYGGAGLALPIPIFARNQGPLAEARAEKDRAAEELALAEHEVAIEVSNLFRAAFARAQEEQLWNQKILPAAESNVELVSQGWRAGKFDLFRVIVVSREAAEAKRKQLEVLGDLWNSAIALARATGAP
jgi:outer membrane protein, heavy metal efflux system